jgi:hypothetical protein
VRVDRADELLRVVERRIAGVDDDLGQKRRHQGVC